METPLPSNVRELKACGYRSRSIKQELRENLIQRLRSGDELFPGIIGYEKTVIPQLINAVLSQHDFILLGLRGQAKTRLARQLTSLLDPFMPILPDFPLNEDPLNPVSTAAKAFVAEHGDDAPVAWVPRDQRYREKLATPDVSMADLIGDIDPIKAANMRLDYSNEQVIHYGIIPRTNRGIFCINELPDLVSRIQVGLLNIMQERDVQIRGFPVRMPLDVVMVYTANPEDYTNRGSIITPLKDRIESQIHTHYPDKLEDAMKITAAEAWSERDQLQIHVPQFVREAVEEVAFQARGSEYLDQASGVSARLPITLLENVISNAERRAIVSGVSVDCVRPIDFQHAVSAVTGKIELVYQGEQEGASNVAKHLVGQGIKAAFDRMMPEADGDGDDAVFGPYKSIVDFFGSGERLRLDDTSSTASMLVNLRKIAGLAELASAHFEPSGDEELASVMEFILEGLHQAKMIGKDYVDGESSYYDMLGDMLEGMDIGR